MGDLLNYQSDKKTIVELLENGIHFSPYLLRDFNIAKGEYFPAIVQSHTSKVYMMSWGIDNYNQSLTLTQIYFKSFEKQSSLKKLLVNNRILIPVNQLMQNKDEYKPELVIRSKENNILYMAGIWKENEDGSLGFAIITKDVTEEYSSKIRRIPLFITSREDIATWLKKDTKIINELNYFLKKKVDVEILHDIILV
ncbi:SOS response-associated peptidase family protein [Membranihabitans marinus]|uniref:SOS response-associated peptidase family protein n=1 Tax=Membranihabitans marinus TaxID=1227546 RepID=UPI001F01DC91|nr:SOS response-associated peptidase family protein [Membranihabitans marinus]